MTCDLERPCTRCIKRGIGHLCHDEPRETRKGSRHDHDPAQVDDEDPPALAPVAGPSRFMDVGDRSSNELLTQPQPQSHVAATAGRPAMVSGPAAVPDGLGLAEMPFTTVGQGQVYLGDDSQILGYNNWSLGAQNQFQDMHTFHPSCMFKAPEVTNEYNLLNNFLSNSLLDENAVYGRDNGIIVTSGLDPLAFPPPLAGLAAAPISDAQQEMGAEVSQMPEAPANFIPRPASTKPSDKARETFYFTAADPHGSDPPEERMNRLLRAKHDAGLLKPFNYAKGYARMSQYMERHLQPVSRQKILRQLDKFRPTFRERMQKLTDMELVLVEMWFERSLMAYDRVFASMAIPACCWRRTGEIYRANKEMAELIHVPIERLRDGKLAIHEIFEEGSLVSYWEKFGTIAFDQSQKAMLTSCILKNPDPASKVSVLHCCFSFTIRRDHNIPSLIVGNFLPMDSVQR